MRKTIIILTILAGGLFFGGCNSWLDVKPYDSMAEDQLYSTENGIQRALNGLYLSLASNDLYAENLGGGAIDVLGQRYKLSSGHTYYDLNEYNYTNDGPKGTFEAIWKAAYKLIADCNEFLEKVPEHQDLMSQANYRMSMGEALAIRACCHLDLMRLWGPSPKYVDAGKTYLPYVVKNSADRYEYMTYDKYMSLLLEDLNRAEKFLLESDPVVDDTFESSEMANVAWPFRKSRINYYGVLGLQARARLWYGDTEKALEYARMVINAKNADGSSKVRLMTLQEDGKELLPNYFTLPDPSAYAEHLCGLKCEDYDVNKGGWMGALNVQKVLYINGYDSFMAFKDLYENNVNDLRYSKIWNKTENAISMTYRAEFKKYGAFYISTTNDCKMNFPIVRLSEMYLLVMEKAPLTEANEAWKKFSAARELEYVPYTESDREERVYKEWLKEFIGEGQNFYTYKRYGATRMVFNDTEITPDQYIVSIPEKEYLK